MVLPGVPRTKRIQFVKEVVCLLLEEGLEGVTSVEHREIAEIIEKLLSQIETVPDEPEQEVTGEPENC